MFTVALLILFTIICALLSGDRAWDNVTKPERNALVFDGRPREYGAFELRRDYDRRFVLAFFGAVGLMGVAITVPRILNAVGMTHAAIATVRPTREIICTIEPPVVYTPPEAPTPKASTAGAPTPAPTPAPASAAGPVVASDDSLPAPDPHPIGDPGPVNPGTGNTPVTTPSGTGSGESGSSGNTEHPFEAFEVDTIPQYYGGQTAMVQFIQENLRIPELDGLTQKEWVTFVVESDGTVSRVKAKGRSLREFSSAAEHVVTAMPRWKPAVSKGRKVACMLVLPIQVKSE